jgi:hypothetical protein
MNAGSLAVESITTTTTAMKKIIKNTSLPLPSRNHHGGGHNEALNAERKNTQLGRNI